MQRYNAEHLQGEREDLEAPSRWKMSEERSTALSALWRNVITASGMDMPLSSGEAPEFLVTVLWGRHAAQEEIQTMQVQNAEFRTTATNVQGQLSQAQATTT